MAQRTTRERLEREARRRARAYRVRRAVHDDRVRRRRRDDVRAGIVFGVVVVAATLAQIGFFTLGPGKPAPAASDAPSAGPTPTPTAPGTGPTATTPAPSADSAPPSP